MPPDLEATLELLTEVEYDAIFSFKYSRRPNTSALALGDKFGTRPVCAGPYRFVEHKPDRHIRLARFDGYVPLAELPARSTVMLDLSP